MNNKKQKEITIIGAAIIDILAGPVNENVFQTGSMPMDTTKMSFGGDALNEAVALSRMGKNVQLVTKIGDDDAGKSVIEYIKSNALSAESVVVEEGLTTGMNIVLIDDKGERYFLTNPNGSLRKLSENDIVPYIEDAADIVSFASIFVSPLMDIDAMARVFKKVKEKPGRILTADMTKAKKGESLKDLEKILPYIDYIFPNHEEIALLTGETDPYVNAKLLVDAGAACAVVKNGAKGCVICTKDEMYTIPAYKGTKVVDSTGAGDSFAAGFLYGLSNGYSLEECGYFACATASCAIEQVGATEGVLSSEEPMRRYLEMKKGN